MQPKVLLFALASTVSALPSRNVNAFVPAGPTDSRSPCPMLNALANHGFLAHDGLNISMDDLIVGLSDSINLASAATQLVGGLALSTSTTGNASTFDLADLDHHHILEHDSSLSRQDIYFGDNHSFNSTIWDQTATHFPDSTISFTQAAAARADRIVAASAINPEFNMTASEQQNSFIESALYMGVFGNVTTGNAVTEWVGVLFTEERLPYEEGWTKAADEISVSDVLGLVGNLVAATV